MTPWSANASDQSLVNGITCVKLVERNAENVGCMGHLRASIRWTQMRVMQVLNIIGQWCLLQRWIDAFVWRCLSAAKASLQCNQDQCIQASISRSCEHTVLKRTRYLKVLLKLTAVQTMECAETRSVETSVNPWGSTKSLTKQNAPEDQGWLAIGQLNKSR